MKSFFLISITALLSLTLLVDRRAIAQPVEFGAFPVYPYIPWYDCPPPGYCCCLLPTPVAIDQIKPISSIVAPPTDGDSSKLIIGPVQPTNCDAVGTRKACQNAFGTSTYSINYGSLGANQQSCYISSQSDYASYSESFKKYCKFGAYCRQDWPFGMVTK